MDHIICIWDVATGHLLRKLEGHTAKVNSLAFSPDGKLLAYQEGSVMVVVVVTVMVMVFIVAV